MLRMNVVVNRLVSIAVCAAALLPVAAGGRLDSLYARIDKAIASSDAYVARREARITALRQRMGKARGAEAYGVAMSLYAEYKPYMNDSALAWLDRAAGMARSMSSITGRRPSTSFSVARSRSATRSCAMRRR